MRGERGFALVITLLVTALLIALLVEFVSEVYVDTSHSHNFVSSQQAEMLAESGVTLAIKLLKAPPPIGRDPKYTSFHDVWAKPQSYDAGVGTVTVTIEEESGKLDLNSATSQTETIGNEFYQKVAKRLLTKLQISQDLYDALWDWVDTNDSPLPGGGEAAYYSTVKPAIKVKNDRLDTMEELGLVKGFTPEVLTKLKPCVTVYGGAGGVAAQININTAPREILAALDDKLMTGSAVDDILEYRKSKVIKNFSDLPGLDPSLIQAFQGKVSFGGQIYRIHAEAKVGESTSVVEAVVRLSAEQHAILYWREY